MIDQALRCTKRNPQFAYVAPTYSQAKRVAWQIFKDHTRDIPGAEPNESDLRIDIPRPERGDFIRLMLLSAEKPGNVRGIYLDGVVLDEFSESDPIIWTQVVRPALSDRLGWAIFIGTPKGMNHFHDIYQMALGESDWFTAIYKSSETKIVAKEELRAAKIAMSEEEYEQEFECSFTAALVGAYYGKQMQLAQEQNRIVSVPYDSAVPVYTGWDLGIGDTLSIWFCQMVGKEIHLIDYEEGSGIELPEWASVVRQKDYNYDEHYLPHDANARELQTGKSRMQCLRDNNFKNLRVLPKIKLEDGINEVRNMLSRCWFDGARCERGINALKNYRRKWDAKNKIFLQKPLHNWASHSSDAMRTLAMGFNEGHLDKATLPRQAETDYDIYDIGGI